jgi:hypothetical protein
MSRALFLSRLRQGLKGLSPDEIDDIVMDYEAHFSDAIAAGRSETDVAASLGDPLQLGGELRAETKLRRWESRRSPHNFVQAGLGLVGLQAFNIFILLPVVAGLFFACVVAYALYIVGGTGIHLLGGYCRAMAMCWCRRWWDGSDRSVVGINGGRAAGWRAAPAGRYMRLNYRLLNQAKRTRNNPCPKPDDSSIGPGSAPGSTRGAIGGGDVFMTPGPWSKPLIDQPATKPGAGTAAIPWRWMPHQYPLQPNIAQGSAPQVADRPGGTVAACQVRRRRITADASVTHASGKRVEAVVSGAPIRKFVINGENLDLGESARKPGTALSGSGTVSGRGKVDRQPDHRRIGRRRSGRPVGVGSRQGSILTSGDASLSPLGRVKLFIAGSGNLQMLTKPAELRQTIIGSGATQLAEKPRKKRLRRWMYPDRIRGSADRHTLPPTWATARSVRLPQKPHAMASPAPIRPACAGGHARGLSQTTIVPNTGVV